MNPRNFRLYMKKLFIKGHCSLSKAHMFIFLLDFLPFVLLILDLAVVVHHINDSLNKNSCILKLLKVILYVISHCKCL